MVKTFLHSGCYGDILYALPSMQALGGGHLYLCDRYWTKPLLRRADAIIPLLKEQPCITGISTHAGEYIDHDFSTHRAGGLRYGDTIINRQSRWVGAKLDLSKPWLHVPEPDPRSYGKIAVHRCDRWPGFRFPWKTLVQTLGNDLIFVGEANEHRDFCHAYGQIEYCPTKDLLEAAQVIAGAAMFIGNQSCPLAIAEGRHKNTVVEVCCFAPDCLNIRPGNTHVIDGSFDLAALGKYIPLKGEGHITSVEEELIERCMEVYETAK